MTTENRKGKRELDILWAPWRMAYINSEADKTEGCFMCLLPNQEKDRENLILTKWKKVYLMLNSFPYNNAHAMVIPYRHVGHFADLEPDEALEIFQLTGYYLRVMEAVMAPQGFNIGLNLGETAGAGVKDHVHLHIVPRWTGDTNFMPVISGAKVMPDYLLSTYDIIRSYMNDHPREEKNR